jgi:hypothetical protein
LQLLPVFFIEPPAEINLQRWGWIEKGDSIMKKLSLVTLGAAVGFATMALTGGGASAAALQPIQPLAAQQQNANDGMLRLAQYNKKDRRMRDRWDRKRDGKLFRSASAVPPLLSRSLLRNPVVDLAADHRWQHRRAKAAMMATAMATAMLNGLDRYRSYNPRTNTWVSYSGNVNQCNSPYG